MIPPTEFSYKYKFCWMQEDDSLYPDLLWYGVWFLLPVETDLPTVPDKLMLIVSCNHKAGCTVVVAVDKQACLALISAIVWD